MTAATEFIIIPPPDKRAAIERAKSRLMEHLAGRFPDFGFTLASGAWVDVEPGEAEDPAAGFQILPMMGTVGDGWQAARPTYPSAAVLRELREAVDEFDLGAFTLN